MEGVDLYRAQADERDWLLRYRVMADARDVHIARAAQLRIPVAEIAGMLGMSRQHVSKIARGGA